jgi:hypothetical protein
MTNSVSFDTNKPYGFKLILTPMCSVTFIWPKTYFRQFSVLFMKSNKSPQYSCVPVPTSTHPIIQYLTVFSSSFNSYCIRSKCKAYHKLRKKTVKRVPIIIVSNIFFLLNLDTLTCNKEQKIRSGNKVKKGEK